MAFLAGPVGTMALKTAITSFASSATSMLGGLGKSTAQKEAEYTISRITNDLEKTMDINRWCFWTGLISQAEALQNYEYLWNILLQASYKYSEITAAQAARLVSDRDYNGQFAFEWRGMFRDEIANIPADHLSSGYVVPDWQWDWGSEKLKYGDAAPAYQTPVPLPTPGQAQAAIAAGATGPTGSSILKWAAYIGLGWAAVRTFF